MWMKRRRSPLCWHGWSSQSGSPIPYSAPIIKAPPRINSNAQGRVQLKWEKNKVRMCFNWGSDYIRNYMVIKSCAVMSRIYKFTPVRFSETSNCMYTMYTLMSDICTRGTLRSKDKILYFQKPTWGKPEQNLYINGESAYDINLKNKTACTHSCRGQYSCKYAHVTNNINILFQCSQCTYKIERHEPLLL